MNSNELWEIMLTRCRPRHELLRPGPAPPYDGARENYVGGNFGASHRDQRYSASHSAADGSPQSVNVW